MSNPSRVLVSRIRIHSRAMVLFLALALWFTTSHWANAWADSRAQIQVLVASVSTQGKEVDPDLKAMEQDFKRTGLQFTSFKLVQRASLDLAPSQTGVVNLPNGSATVTLIQMDKRSARVKVKAPGSSSEYSMSSGGEIYIDAGSHGAKKLFLAIRR